MKSSSIQATRLAPDTQIKSQSWLSFSGRFARAIRRKRLAIRGDDSILRKSSMPGLYQDTKDRFLTGCIEIRGSSSGVEHHVANVVVVGSNPISRSIFLHTRLAAYAQSASGAWWRPKPSQPVAMKDRRR